MIADVSINWRKAAKSFARLSLFKIIFVYCDLEGDKNDEEVGDGEGDGIR
jgi:hypothetical protein